MTAILDSPAIDADKIHAAHRLQFMTAPRQRRLDHIAEFLADQFDVPMAFISLVDRDWQWARSQKGLSLRSVPREFFHRRTGYHQQRTINCS